MDKYLELIYKMTDMTYQDKKNLEEFLDQLNRKYDISGIQDLDKVNEMQIDNITIESIEDLLEIKWENLDFEGIDWDDIKFDANADSTPMTPFDDIMTSPEDLVDDDFDVSKFKYNKPNEESDKYDSENEIEIHIDDNEIRNDKPFIGKDWLEIDNKYMTYYNIDNKIDVSEINIELRDEYVILTNFDDKLSTESIPKDVENIEAKLTDGSRLLIKVW